MKKVLSLFVLSGAVLGALFFLTQLSVPSASQGVRPVTLMPGDVIRDGSVVSIEYTLTDEKGNVIESNVGKEPMTYIHGAGQIVPGLEKELAGMKTGEQKKVTVKPDEGYGAVNPDLVQELPKDKIPAEALKPGAVLMMNTPQGPIPIRIKEIRDKTVVVDLNNPLAGKTLTFDVKVVDIKSAS
ncbi:MAG TPA: peptidylprolyl isomerase [Candidatus Eisenbacteria bacterium]|nr:peptidylprolyl isomerase [Candidatus Eisenbacteria bacterium]